MYQILILSIILANFTFNSFSQDKSSKIKRFHELNRQTVEKYKEGKFRQSQKIAEESLNISKSLFGVNHIHTGQAFLNFGEVLRARKKNKEAATNLVHALKIFHKDRKKNIGLIIKTMNALGNAFALSGQLAKAESVFVNLIKTAEAKYGNESKELLPFLRTTVYFFVYAKKYSQAEDWMLRRYLVARAVFGSKSQELDDIDDEHFCVNVPRNRMDLTGFRKRINEATGRKPGTVLNGKAISLPKPNYPASASRNRISGVIRIAVTIRKDGTVMNARGVCGGHPYLIESSRKAALKSKFNPTLLDGKPVEARGFIVYTFRP